ncbi:MAG: hypothetical protein ACJAW3_001491 [Lentimonas sp.]|jgi:hypothetical protein
MKEGGENKEKLQSNKNKPKINEQYIRKIISLRKKIALGMVISVIFLLIISAIVIYGQNKNKKNIDDVKKIKITIINLQNKASDIASRVSDVKKYKKIWLQADDGKKDFSPIKISKLNESFNNLVKKYKTTSPNISITAPQILRSGIYDRSHLSLSMVNCKIKFRSLTDGDAANLINELFTSLKGYKIVESLTIQKTPKDILDKNKLIKISRGDIKSLISTELNFYWYFLKDSKDDEINKK